MAFDRKPLNEVCPLEFALLAEVLGEPGTSVQLGGGPSMQWWLGNEYRLTIMYRMGNYLEDDHLRWRAFGPGQYTLNKGNDTHNITWEELWRLVNSPDLINWVRGV